jgi:hypothetical protein
MAPPLPSEDLAMRNIQNPTAHDQTGAPTRRLSAERQRAFAFVGDYAPCTHPQRRLKWRLLATGGAHLGAYCRQCNTWISWLRQNRATLAEAPPRPGRPTRTNDEEEEEEEEGVP